MAYSWSIPQYAFQAQVITAVGYVSSSVITLDNTYSTHFVAFTGSSPIAGTDFTLTLYGQLIDGQPTGGVPYEMGSINSTTNHSTGGWQAGYNNTGFILVQEVPAAMLFVDVNLTSGGPITLTATVVSANL